MLTLVPSELDVPRTSLRQIGPMPPYVRLLVTMKDGESPPEALVRGAMCETRAVLPLAAHWAMITAKRTECLLQHLLQAQTDINLSRWAMAAGALRDVWK